MKLNQHVLEVLADGKFHSGEEIARSLGVTRMAVWKHIQSLKSRGLPIDSIKRRGYSLSGPVELLSGREIRPGLSPSAKSVISQLDIEFELDSTNTRLISRLPGHAIHGHALLAECQTGGRGSRADRQWASPLTAGIYLSLGWHFSQYPDSFTALSLATGVAVARALQNSGVNQVRLKWPNDILYRGGKLGGILIESRGIAQSYCDVVIGVGLNYRLQDRVKTRFEYAAADLHDLGGDIPSRNHLAAALLNELVAMLLGFQSGGAGPYLKDWRKLDYFCGREARLVFQGRIITGTVSGIGDNGQLMMLVNGKMQGFSAGELSLREAPR